MFKLPIIQLIAVRNTYFPDLQLIVFSKQQFQIYDVQLHVAVLWESRKVVNREEIKISVFMICN